jgi:predicted ATPase/DNA-binding XRE family transcriptional regulator
VEVPPEPFGVRLRRLRERAGLTQEELGERAGLSSKAIGALERSERRHPYPHTLRALAAALGLSAPEQAALEAGIPGRRERLPGLGNLPAEITGFVGRSGELAEVLRGLASSRLLTVVGPGGVGKTRLALRAAAALRAEVRDGVWLVELADLGDGALVPKAVLAALGMRDQSGAWSSSTVARRLAGRNLLLVLDTCEHLLDACAGMAAVLLRELPGIRILATSRQALGISGERVVSLGPMAPSDSLALFMQRAEEATARFSVTTANRDAVAELCRRLDGIPLAIELAAVRLRTMGVDQILARLNDRFDLLTGGSRAALPRQQTLRAAIEWSHDLLEEHERAVLRRLAVFAGSFTLEAGEAVCSFGSVPVGAIVNLMAALVEKSVVNLEDAAGVRYRLHETMREYARLRLAEDGEEEAAVRAHLDYHLGLCRRADEEWFGGHLLAWLDRLDLETADIRAALERCLTGEGDFERGLELAGHLWFYWMSRAVGEGAHWLDRLLRRADGDHRARAGALFARGVVAMHQPNFVACRETLGRAAELARELGDGELLVRSLACLAIAQALADDDASAQATAEQATAAAERSGRPAALVWAAQSRVFAFAHRGDVTQARPAYERLVEIASEHGDVWMLSYGHLNLGFGLLLADRASSEARWQLEEALRLKRRLDDRPGIGYALAGLACHAAASGEAERAATLLGMVEVLHQREGTRAQPLLHPYLEETRLRALAALGPTRFEAGRSRGAAADRETTIAFALGGSGPATAPLARPASDSTS